MPQPAFAHLDAGNQFDGYQKHSRQVNVLRHVRSRLRPPTRAKLVQIIATEMDTFLVRHNRSAILGRH